MNMVSLSLSLCNTNILISGIYGIPSFNINKFSDIIILITLRIKICLL